MERENFFVRISSDEMQAFLTLAEPFEGEEYTLSETLQMLSENKVTYGIDEAAIQEMIEMQSYGKARMVARGAPKMDGVDGYFDYKFNSELNFKPTQRFDGSVDYHTIHVIEVVEEGQIVAEYHDPEDSNDGMTVTGKKLIAKRGRPLPPLMGKGFERSEDGKTYTAVMGGKIELVNNRVVISKVYEVSGDVDMKTGDIDFQGDVIVHGNVIAGMTVKATGSITVDGIVEAATLECGGDVLIRGGVLGAYRASITTKGNISAKFMEYTTVNAKGNIETDSLVNCNIKSNDHLYMSGKHASIIGGYVYAACGMDLYAIGSATGTITKVVVGMEFQQLQLIQILKRELEEIEQRLTKIEKAIAACDNLSKTDPTRLLLLRNKIQAQSDVNERKKQLEDLLDLRERSQFASVKAVRTVFAGVTITIGTETTQVSEDMSTVEFRLDHNTVHAYSLQAV